MAIAAAGITQTAAEGLVRFYDSRRIKVMQHEYRSRPLAILIAIDQLGNTIAGGNPDSTISARVGFFSANALRGRSYWRGLERIIDFAFFPIDGENHCYNTWQGDDERYLRGSDFARVLLSLIIFIICPVIAIVLRVLVLFFRSWRYQ